MDTYWRKTLEAQDNDFAKWLRGRIVKIEQALAARADMNDSPEKLALLREGLVSELEEEAAAQVAEDRILKQARLQELAEGWKREHRRDPAEALLEHRRAEARYAAMSANEIRRAYDSYLTDPDRHLPELELDLLRAAHLRAFPQKETKDSERVPDPFRATVETKKDAEPWRASPEAVEIEHHLAGHAAVKPGYFMLEIPAEETQGREAPAFLPVKIADVIGD